MKTNLIVTDPLAEKEVSIMMTVAAGGDGEGHLPREKRPFLLSVGVAGQMPISRSGTLGDVTALIHEAWTAFGVREQVNGQAAETATSAQLSTGVCQPIAEELVAEAVVTPTSNAVVPPPTVSVTKPATPKRPVSKLSLF